MLNSLNNDIRESRLEKHQQPPIDLDSDDDNIEEIETEDVEQEELDVRTKKAATISPENKNLCFWPTFHEDLTNLKHKNQYQGIPMGTLVAEKFKTRSAAAENLGNMDLNRDAVIQMVQKRGKCLVNFLKEGLSKKVFSAEDILVIEQGRTLLDLESLMEKVARFGAVQVSSTLFPKWFEASKFFEHDLEVIVSRTDYRSMFTEFLRKLEALHHKHEQKKSKQTPKQKVDQEKQKKKLVLQGLTSKEILGLFLNPVHNLYQDIETVLNILCRAAVSKSVESVVESWISTMENHAAGGRPLGQDRMEDECMISINGPSLVHCSSVVKAAHREYWNKAKREKEQDGHFVRTSEGIKQYTVSKVVDRLRSKEPRLPFMK